MSATMPEMAAWEAEPSRSGRWRGGTVAWLCAPGFALQFLTVLPPVIRRAARADELGRAEAFFPAVGLLLGAALALADLLLAPLVQPLVLAVVLAALLAILTGALHLDGVVDTFDGLFAGRSVEQRLAIMRDPRAGSYGVVAVALLLALKVAALASLPPPTRAVALLLAPCFGRWSIVLATSVFPYARPEGMGRAFKDSIRPAHAAMAAATGLVAAGLLAGLAGLAIWAALSGLVWLAGRWIARRLGGLSGDTYGALCELTETGALLAFTLRLGAIS